MARHVIKLPDVGEGIAEAELVAWHVDVGDDVAEDQALAEVMTDKATVELPSPRAGRVVSRTGTPGERVRVGSELVVLETDSEAPTKPAAPPASVPDALPLLAPRDGARPLAAPAVRRRAQLLGIALDTVPTSGHGGRVTHADLDALLTAGGGVPRGAGRREGVEEMPVIGLRRRIAERMQEAKRRIPHFSYVEELDVTALEALRADLNARHEHTRRRLTLLPFLLRALARAVPLFPQVNAVFDDEAGIVRRHAALHAGIATQTPQGLMVPVIHHAEALDPWQLAAEIARLSAAAREGRATRDELAGSTLTVTSLGALGGIVTTPVINHPEVAVIAVNRIVERPVIVAGRIETRKIMNLSSSFDHRVVDGWDAAQFVQELKRLLEQPAMLFID